MKLEQKRKLKFKRNIYKLSILIFIFMVVWVAFELISAFNNPDTGEIQVTPAELAPLSSNLYLELAEKLYTDRVEIDMDLIDELSIPTTVIPPAEAPVEIDLEEVTSASESTSSAL